MVASWWYYRGKARNAKMPTHAITSTSKAASASAPASPNNAHAPSSTVTTRVASTSASPALQTALTISTQPAVTKPTRWSQTPWYTTRRCRITSSLSQQPVLPPIPPLPYPSSLTNIPPSRPRQSPAHAPILLALPCLVPLPHEPAQLLHRALRSHKKDLRRHAQADARGQVCGTL